MHAAMLGCVIACQAVHQLRCLASCTCVPALPIKGVYSAMCCAGVLSADHQAGSMLEVWVAAYAVKVVPA